MHHINGREHTVPWRNQETFPALGVFSASFSILMASFSNKSIYDSISATGALNLVMNSRSTTYKGFSNNLALFLRLRNALEAVKEKVGAINHCEVNSEMLFQRLLHFLGLVEAHQSYHMLVSVRPT
jgi:hypothetical protein